MTKITPEIEQLKHITSRDGGVLFVHVFKDSCAHSPFVSVNSISKYCSELPLSVELIYKYLWEFENEFPNCKHHQVLNDNLPLCIASRFISRWIRIFMGYGSEPRFDSDIWDLSKKIVSERTHI